MERSIQETTLKLQRSLNRFTRKIRKKKLTYFRVWDKGGKIKKTKTREVSSFFIFLFLPSFDIRNQNSILIKDARKRAVYTGVLLGVKFRGLGKCRVL